MDPRIEDINIEDIAHALSNQCRFAGHCLRFYSVAEHSILLSHIVPKEDAMWALVHDASEAYLVDVPRPLKPFLIGYKEIESSLMAIICKRFNLPLEMPRSVAVADIAILSDEANQNMSKPPMQWQTNSDGCGVRLSYLCPSEAEDIFLNRYDDLMR